MNVVISKLISIRSINSGIKLIEGCLCYKDSLFCLLILRLNRQCFIIKNDVVCIYVVDYV